MKGTTRHPMNDALLAAMSLEEWVGNRLAENADYARDARKLLGILGEGGKVKTENAKYEVKGGALIVTPLAD